MQSTECVFKLFLLLCMNQRGSQNPYIEEQTTQWANEQIQKDKQRSKKHAHKTKDLVTRTLFEQGGEKTYPLYIP